MKHSLLLALVFVSSLSVANGMAIMSIDFGSQFMKIAIVKPGVPMEIVLNKESKRKTPTTVSLASERLFGENAQAKMSKNPASTFPFLSHLIGVPFDDARAELYRQRFGFADMVKIEDSGLIAFKLADGSVYSVDELVAMILEYGRHLASDYAEQKVKDAVLIIPAYLSQSERRAMMRCAELAGITVLQLITDHAAVALNYGVFRRKSFNATQQYYMFYDMGASHTTASIVSYQVVKTKLESGMTDTHPQVTVKGVAFDRGLGGLEMTFRLVNKLADIFNEKNKGTDIRKNGRAMGKLFKEADRVKSVLSANNEHYAQVESLVGDTDFKAKVTRAEFVELCADLFDRVGEPVKQALELSEITMSEINEVILMGGSTRVPLVQERLQAAVKRSELGKSINTDEAAALGGVYQAAHLSTGYRVKKFLVKDATVTPLSVVFERVTKKEDSAPEEHPGFISRSLFGAMAVYPQRKIMTFAKHLGDFEFNTTYGDLSSAADPNLRALSNAVINRTHVGGVAYAAAKYAGDAKVESKGVKVHFRMDDSGILHLDSVEFQFERAPPTADEIAAMDESAFSKIGSKISSFFGSGDAENGTAENNTDTLKEEGEKAGDGKPDDKDSATDKNKTDKKPTVNATETNVNVTKKAPIQTKPVLLREPIDALNDQLDLLTPQEAELVAMRERLAKLHALDVEKADREKAYNSLEAFIYTQTANLEEDEWLAVTTEEQRTQFTEALNAARDWLEEQPFGVEAELLKAKRKELRDLTAEARDRVKERRDLPAILDALTEHLNYSDHFLAGIHNMSSEKLDPPMFTEVEITTLEKLILTTYTWRNESVAAHEAAPAHEKPLITVRDVQEKLGQLDREMKYLLNKAKSYKPKVSETPKTEKKTNKTKAQANATAEKTADGEPIDKTPVDGAEPIVTPDTTTEQSDTEKTVLETPPETAESQADADTPAESPDIAGESPDKAGVDNGIPEVPDDVEEPVVGDDDERTVGKSGHDPVDEL